MFTRLIHAVYSFVAPPEARFGLVLALVSTDIRTLAAVRQHFLARNATRPSPSQNDGRQAGTP